MNTRQELSRFKFVNHLDRLQRLAGGEDPAGIPPVTIEIDPTNICNSGCWWCSTADVRRRVRTALEPERVFSLLDELRDFQVRSVVFKGGGDPTMVKWLDRAVVRAGELGLAVGVNTNGARMTDDLHAALVRHGSWVRFSVDAASEETYRKVHRTREWWDVIRNISQLVEERNRAGAPLQVGINHNLDRYNVHEVPAMVEVAEQLGADYVSIRPVYGNIAPSGVSAEELELGERLDAAMAEASRLAAEKESIEVKVGNVRNAIGVGLDDPGPCLAPTLTGIVCADGEVAACCDLRGQPAYSFGNIYEQSFREIWESDRRREIVSQHTSKRECDPHCSHAYAYYNQVLHYLGSARPQREFL